MIAFDIETSAADPYAGSIVSLWAIEIEDPTNQFYEECRMLDWALVQDRALEVNGFTREQIMEKTKQSVGDLITSFMGWRSRIQEQTLLWQNVGYFDVRFLEENGNKEGIEHNFWLVHWGYRTIDIHSLVINYHLQHNIPYPLKDNASWINLDYSANFVWLPSEIKPHHGLNGAKLSAEIFSRIVYGKKLLPEYEQYDIPKRV
ncbi:MAG: Exonuclease RNase T and DNA polymerase III [uncultured bacterium (gcode 4)]|uniref:Exonuclease RNase T and DNA polymerase III n=1 Tax=uncultured bacterium (gcode 4) TaxID=1234023 RepID=K1YNQ5_9BACT|nr:MAG: Exonuclease RNase T and DNA polymerase III [uncultured bacterium (gcode 4)]